MSGDGEDDVALKLLHTADWHLGMRFRSFAEHDERTLRRARLSVIDRILGLADHHGVDAVLCAGDLFDDAQPDEEWWRGLADKLARRPVDAAPVFLLPGNHDPLTPTSVWHPTHRFRGALPPSVHVVDRDDFTHPLGEHAVLHAVPCRSTAGQSDPTERLPARTPGDARIRIGMVHGSTFEFADWKTNFPVSVEAATARGFDYMAIGDTHGFRVYPPDDHPTVYPGAPEPTKFGELEAGRVALVFFSRRNRRPLVRSEKVAYWSWQAHRCADLAALRRLRDDDLARTVLRLELQMRLSAAEYEEAQTIVRDLAGTNATHGRAGVLQLDSAGLELDARGLAGALDELPESLRAAAARLAERAEAGEDAEVARRALWHLVRLVREAR
jgi:DNA repair exonuclease SbcCD nuclease subunit